MKKVKILHCSDMHFDTPFKELSKKISDISKEELLESFKRIIDLVISEEIEVLLIAGDIFDNISLNKTTLFFIVNQLKRILNTYVFISPGNHDPYNDKSFYKIVNWPKNVYIFKGKMEKVTIEKLNLNIWGCGFNNTYEKESLFKDIKIDEDLINIMVIHGEICGENSKSEYNPIYLKDIALSGLDYIALGHRHEFSGILKEGKTYYSYSGCPQGRGFDETGEKGVVIGDVYKENVDLKFLNITKRLYVEKEIDVSGVNTYEEVKEKIVENIHISNSSTNLYKIILKGAINGEFNLKEEVLKEKLLDYFYYVKIENKTTIDIDLEEISKDYSLKGKFVFNMLKKLEQAKDNREREIINMALKIGLQSLSSEEVNIYDN